MLEENKGTYVFLFDSQHPEIGSMLYGLECIKRVLLDLLENGEDGSICTLIRQGDIILSRFSETISELSANSHRGEFNKERHVEIAWEAIDCMIQGDCSFDVNEISKIIHFNQIYVVCFTSLDKEKAVVLNRQLKSFPPYLGYANIDNGNPLLRVLFVEQLIPTSFIFGKDIGTTEHTLSLEAFQDVVSLKNLTYNIKTLSDEEFYDIEQQCLVDEELSERGKISLKKIQDNSWKSHHNKVAEELYRFALDKKGNVALSTNLPEGFESIVIPKSKLEGYALNPNHNSGKEKAHVFKEKLGLSSFDGDYLALQIKNKLQGAEIETLDVTSHGVQYSARLEVEGKNGNILTIITSWIIRNGQPPAQLTSVRVEKEKKQLNKEENSLFISESFAEPERWGLILEKAHEHAMRAFKKKTPRPVLFGDTVEREGICGYAYITLPDARRKICRWAIKNGKGRSGFGGLMLDASPDISTQSYDRNCAYAYAFSYVLKLNSIEHEVKPWVD